MARADGRTVRVRPPVAFIDWLERALLTAH